MGFLHRSASPGSIRALIWVAGLAALLGAVVGWVLPAQPYQAPWAWISFIGMCIVDDFLFGSKEGARWGELPKLTLFAAIIMFRRHPEITVLVAVTAAPLASLLKGQTWSTQLTATSQWILAAVFGAITFRLVGFGDTAHFVAATAALMVVYYALGPVVSALLQAGLTATDFRDAFRTQRRLTVSMLAAGALLALAWRTPWLEPAALKVADGTLVTVAGIFAGFLLGGRASHVFARGIPIPVRPLVVAGAVLAVSEVTPGPLSWLLPLGLAIVAGIWAVWRRVYPVACGALGAYCNEIVRAANGGRMPVDGQGVLAAVGSRADTYVLAGPHTNFAWLDDRFALPAPFPGIASAGDILIAIGMAWFVATLMLRHPAAVAEGAADDAGDAPAIEDARGDAAAAA
ncbi:MAG TPA: DUF5317 family protein [Candidatus Dormibacteraeota bacterium]